MTSQGSHEDGAVIVKKINNRMRTQCAFLMEARIFDHVDYDNFLRAFEFGVVDCGLFLGDRPPTGTRTDVLFQLQDLCGNERLIAGIDVKAIINLTVDWAGGIGYHLGLSNKDQYDAAEALIVTAPSEPNFVALIPTWYVRVRVDKVRRLQRVGIPTPPEEKVGFLDGHRHMWMLHRMPAFAPELRPFMHPIVQLSRALQIMRNYAKGDCSEWANEHTGVIYQVPAPRASPFRILEPRSKAWKTALEAIKVVHRAFGAYSDRFKVQFVEILPITADFKFFQESTGLKIFVEAKKSHCKFNLDVGAASFMSHAQWDSKMERLVFSWKAQWDFLYTLDIHERQALFIPRDFIPQTFWNARPCTADEWLDWPIDDLDMLRECVVRVTNDRQLAIDMERILDMTERRTRSMKAQNPIPIKSSVAEMTAQMREVEADELEENDEPTLPTRQAINLDDLDIEDTPTSFDHRDYQRGFGSHLHEEGRGLTYENWAKEALIELCRQWYVVASNHDHGRKG
ncbi:MAG: hypothetical protein Q9180_005010 [Flavoplaca navasiana]